MPARARRPALPQRLFDWLRVSRHAAHKSRRQCDEVLQLFLRRTKTQAESRRAGRRGKASLRIGSDFGPSSRSTTVLPVLLFRLTLNQRELERALRVLLRDFDVAELFGELKTQRLA